MYSIQWDTRCFAATRWAPLFKVRLLSSLWVKGSVYTKQMFWANATHEVNEATKASLVTKDFVALSVVMADSK